MKTSLKVILLLFAVVAVAGSLLFFAKSRLDPPRPIVREGDFTTQAQQLINGVHQGLDSDTLNKRWFAANHLIGFLNDNHLLRAGESDTLKMSLMEKYVPAFVRKCELKFGWSIWEESDLGRMRNRIKLLRKVEDSHHRSVLGLQPSLNGQVEKVANVLDNYDQAHALTTRHDFKSLTDSKNRIQKARRFKSDSYLRNNTHLMSELDSVAVRLERAHYRYLERSVEALANYGTSWEAFQERYDDVGLQVSLFADSVRAVYGYYHGVADLRSEMRHYYREADDHFNNRSAWDVIMDAIF